MFENLVRSSALPLILEVLAAAKKGIETIEHELDKSHQEAHGQPLPTRRQNFNR